MHAVAGGDRLGELGVAPLQRVEDLRQQLLGETAHLRDLLVEESELLVVDLTVCLSILPLQRRPGSLFWSTATATKKALMGSQSVSTCDQWANPRSTQVNVRFDVPHVRSTIRSLVRALRAICFEFACPAKFWRWIKRNEDLYTVANANFHEIISCLMQKS